MALNGVSGAKARFSVKIVVSVENDDTVASPVPRRYSAAIASK